MDNMAKRSTVRTIVASAGFREGFREALAQAPYQYDRTREIFRYEAGRLVGTAVRVRALKTPTTSSAWIALYKTLRRNGDLPSLPETRAVLSA